MTPTVTDYSGWSVRVRIPEVFLSERETIRAFVSARMEGIAIDYLVDPEAKAIHAVSVEAIRGAQRPTQGEIVMFIANAYLRLWASERRTASTMPGVAAS